jgi:hypothetical protein
MHLAASFLIVIENGSLIDLFRRRAAVSSTKSKKVFPMFLDIFLRIYSAFILTSRAYVFILTYLAPSRPFTFTYKDW